MKLRALTLAMALLAILLTHAAAQPFLTNGLVAYYPFNGNANDASGKGNDGTVNGATLTSDRFGIANSAYSFNGTNNYIGFAGVPTTQVDNWTMTAWVQPASLSQVGIAVALGYDDGSSANGYSFGLLNAVGPGFVPGNQLYVIFDGLGQLFSGFDFTSTNQWYQVVMLRDSGVTKFYVDGALTPNSTTATPYAPSAFRIGSENGIRFFNGAIDDVRIYNRALASNEVAQLYAYESPPPSQTFLTNGLVAYYPFNGNANDVSGNGNNANNIQASLCADRFGVANSAYSFNGINNYIGFAGAPTSQVDNWTISAWLQPASLSQVGIAVDLGYDDGSTANGYSFGILNPVGPGFVPGNQLYEIFDGLGQFYSGFNFTSTNQWYQVVMLRDSGVTKFYLNGSLTPNSSTVTPLAPSSFRIGSENGIRFFNGVIDDVRIYNRALASNEVAQLYSFESGFCSPHAAQATAIVTNGFMVGATITDNGCGYTNAPLVLISGGGGSNATATATIQNGFVTSINIINPGAGYTTLPDILIGSPPFVPTLTINVSRVNVTQHVVLGFNYVLESSPDMINWTATGPPFTAQSEEITTEFVVNQTGQYFRIRQVP
jgi:hypothetical protein